MNHDLTQRLIVLFLLGALLWLLESSLALPVETGLLLAMVRVVEVREWPPVPGELLCSGVLLAKSPQPHAGLSIWRLGLGHVLGRRRLGAGEHGGEAHGHPAAGALRRPATAAAPGRSSASPCGVPG